MNNMIDIGIICRGIFGPNTMCKGYKYILNKHNIKACDINLIGIGNAVPLLEIDKVARIYFFNYYEISSLLLNDILDFYFDYYKFEGEWDSDIRTKAKIESLLHHSNANIIKFHEIDEIILEVKNRLNELDFDFSIENVIFNGPATIIYWKDGTKTVVKCENGDKYDKEKGLALCFMKRALGNSGNYYNIIKEYINENKTKNEN